MRVLLLCMLLLAALPRYPATAAQPAVSDTANLPQYSIDAFLDTDAHTLDGTLRLEWINLTGEIQDALWFRLYPNAPYYNEGEMVISAVDVNEGAADFEVQQDATVLRVDLDNPAQPQDQVVVQIEFTSTIPVDQTAGFGIFQHDTRNGIWNLADWYPVLAGWEDESGWYLQEPTSFGDPTFSETAMYEVALELPETITLISTGSVANIQTGLAGTTRYFVETDPAREFAMTLIEDAVISTEVEADDVTVRVSLPEAWSVDGLSGFMAETAASALEQYEQWMGAYPSDEFDVSVAELTGGAAVSWSGITWFDLSNIAADGVLSDEEEIALAFVIFHEVGHQWIADVVGSNNNDHGFMSEGLVNSLAVLATQEVYGEERANDYLSIWVAGPYLSLLRDERDAVADAPLTNETNGVIRSLVIYGKGGLGFLAIYNQIGEDAFLEGMGSFAETYRFAIAEPEDLLASFEEASGSQLDDLWNFWFLQADATLADAEAVIAEFAA